MLLAAAPANAGISGNYRVRAGLGAQIVPSFPGSKSEDWLLWPKFSIAKDDEQFRFSSHDDNVGIALISSHGFSAGPVGNVRKSRKESEVGAPVGDVSSAIEAGIFAQEEIGDSFRLRGEVMKGFSGHDGFVSVLGADWIIRDGDKYLFAIGPRLRIADSDFVQTYFGVTPAAAVASGLPAYSPGGGVYGVGATSGFNYALGKNVGVIAYASYTRLVGDARHSPIVEQFGSPDEYSAGLGLSYTFNLTL